MARFPDPVARRLWQQRLRRFEQGRLTIAAFCQTERVSVASFYYWRRILRHDAPPNISPELQRNTTAAKPDFLSVKVVAAATVDVQLPNGVRLALPADNHDALKAVLDCVGQLPPLTSRENQTC